MTETEPRTPGDTTTFMTQLTVGGLSGRTFNGLLVAQFLAAFNDQAIHAAAMFFAINTQAMSERDAISLMPILFYAPWAIFCTVAGWLADKYSKRTALVTWKLAEIGIAAVALTGFWAGRHGYPVLGPWLVFAAVFGMGTHSSFFVPAKYGIMPEILPPEQLSKGNGVLESLSFFAVILGTVSGGVLSFRFLGEEYIVGLILLGLAVVGALASFLIRQVPAANPGQPFPAYIYGPLVTNIRTFLQVKALRLALQGIAFFTFVVAFMRAAVYMLGESQNPRWDELRTSAIVGTVSLGIVLGSPLAGWLSGKKIELRLVSLGAAGMVAMLLAAAAFVDMVPWLVASIVGIGFFTGFYIVPLFTLLQHKAPKAKKGEMIATGNFVNVTGAIAASLLFFGVVLVAQRTGLAPEVTDRQFLGTGTLKELPAKYGRPTYFRVETAGGSDLEGGAKRSPERPREFGELVRYIFKGGSPREVLEIQRDVKIGGDVDVSRYKIGDVVHYDLVPAGVPPTPDYDNRHLPRFLFVGAAGMTGLILVALARPLRRLRKQGV
jgi:MFS family permease